MQRFKAVTFVNKERKKLITTDRNYLLSWVESMNKKQLDSTGQTFPVRVEQYEGDELLVTFHL